MKITKKELFKFCDDNNDAINELQSQSDSTNFLLAVLIKQLKDSGVIDEISPEPKPQLKQLGVDLSSELTGSELCKAMLANTSKPIMCAVSDISTRNAMSFGNYELIHDYTDEHSFMSLSQTWSYAVPINSQGEPLTQAEAGL